MSEQTKTLLVDIGNTRIKCAYAKSDPQHISTFHCADLKSFRPYLTDVDHVIVASVKSAGAIDELEAICTSQGVSLQCITTAAQAFGIRCAYTEYTNLGVDRWLAILGARLHTSLPVGVIDLGTAATFDFVVDDQHTGGWIAPGFGLMKDAVTQNTSRVFGDNQLPESLSLGKGTTECVNYGCQAMLEGFVLSAIDYIEKHSNDYKVFVCGGNASLVEHLFGERVKYKPDIVLQGLSRFG